MRALLAAIGIAGTTLLLAACRPDAPPADAAARLAAMFEDLHRRELFDGAVVVSVGGRLVFSQGYGLADVERGVPLTPDTPVDGASLAKTFTAALVLQLAHEGRLSLDEPVAKLLPELPYPELTLRHLLGHSNGLPDYPYFDAFLPADQVRTTETLLRVLAQHKPKLAFRPGSAFEYSSLGYDLAALAAARAARSTYANLLQQRYFAPLGMRSAFVRPGRLGEFPGVRTIGYRRTPGRLERNEVFDFEAFHGGSNIYFSARDLARWNESFLLDPVLDARSLSLGLEPVVLEPGRSGLNLLSWYQAPERRAYWYLGHLRGFHSLAYREHGSGLSIVYVCNNTIESWMQHALARAVRDIVAGREPEPLTRPPTVALGAAEYAGLTGDWRTGDGQVFPIEGGDGKLWLTRRGVRYRMFPDDPRSFYVPGLDLIVGFERDGSGAPSRIRVSSNLGVETGPRAAGPPR